MCASVCNVDKLVVFSKKKISGGICHKKRPKDENVNVSFELPSPYSDSLEKGIFDAQNTWKNRRPKTQKGSKQAGHFVSWR